jgi:hypothetical protein
MAPSKVFIHHVRLYDVDGMLTKGGATVAIKPTDVEGVIEVAIAYCSLLDGYNKHRGRDIAAGRLNKGKGFQIEQEETVDETLSQAIKLDDSHTKMLWIKKWHTEFQGKLLRRRYGRYLEVTGDTLKVWGWR